MQKLILVTGFAVASFAQGAGAKMGEFVAAPSCGQALQSFPTTRPRGVYPSGFKAPGKSALASLEFVCEAHALKRCRDRIQDLGRMKLGELVRELHEIAFVSAKRAQPTDGARGVVDRAAGLITRQQEISLSPYFDELRVILGDLSQWYRGSFARIALLRALARVAEVQAPYAHLQGEMLYALAAEIADLGAGMKDADLRELKNVTAQLLAQDATLTRPARRFAFVASLIDAHLGRDGSRTVPLAMAYHEYLLDQLRPMAELEAVHANLSDSARADARRVVGRLISGIRADRDFLAGYNIDFIYSLATRLEQTPR